MGRVLLIAVRDFRQTVLTKAFLFGVLGVPVLLIFISGVAGILMAGQQKPPIEGRLIVVTSQPEVIDRIRAALSPDTESPESQAVRETIERASGGRGSIDPSRMSLPGFERIGRIDVEGVTALPSDPDDRADIARLNHRQLDLLSSGSLLAVVVIPDSAFDPAQLDAEPSFQLTVPAAAGSDVIGVLERRIGRVLVDVRAERLGADAQQMRSMLRAPAVRTQRMLASGELRSEDQVVRLARQVIIPMAFAILLWAATLGTGQHLLMSTIEEKSNRVMEVLLSAVSPTQILAGKILGQSAVGLIVVGVYSGLGILALIAAARADLVQPIQLVYLFVYFILAYLMVASLMAAVGSAVSDIREANSLLTPVMLLLMVPMMLWLPISRAPNGIVATAASFIPPAGPFTMILRVTAEEPIPLWQIPATIVVGGLSVAAMIWMAGRIFRVGVLLTGKPPSLFELLRWIRAR